MIIFVAGMPRAGSMWTYNVVRAIFEAMHYSVLPALIPVDEMDLIQRALASEEKEREVYCIKTHLPLKIHAHTKHEVRIICNIRDVRDACLSIMRFMRAEYEVGLSAMINMMKVTDYYLSTYKDNLLDIRFEEINNTPQEVLESISNFIGIQLSESDKQKILGTFSKSSVQKKLRAMSDIEFDTNGRMMNPEQHSRFDSVRNFDGTYRVYDKNTAFQSNHITSDRDGEWRTCFDQQKIEQINELSREWLLRHGYKI